MHTDRRFLEKSRLDRSQIGSFSGLGCLTCINKQEAKVAKICLLCSTAILAVKAFSGRRKECILWVLMALLVCVAAGVFVREPKKVLDYGRIHAYLPDTNVSVSAPTAAAQTARIISNFDAANTRAKTLQAVQISSEMQMRGFYMAILVLIAGLLFKNNKDGNARGMFILVLVVLTMYAIDIHSKDEGERRAAWDNAIMNSGTDLVNLPPNNTRRYKINYDSLGVKNSKYYDNWPRWERELEAALTPDIEQIALYIVPLILVIGYRIISKGNHNLQRGDSTQDPKVR